ncbi:tyrosyl-tRNA synthetase [Nakamurella sp. UYEF19]|uniref:tyrosine--tRNA ligase n=1 Tax=Nakamurella sp. UYEF19 TaxID=1756392 RepID=UPI00339A269A
MSDENPVPPTTHPLLEDLHWRGLIAQSTDEPELAAALSAGPVSFYGGFDPTARSLHIGNLVLLLTMRRIQEAGHRPLGLVGGATGLIGDPRMSGERVLNGPEVVAQWVAQIQSQVEKYLDFTGPFAARIVNNLDWTAPMSAIDFLRDVGKHFRMGRMLSKEIVSARLHSDEGLSFTEFSYQILQGMDFLELHRRYGCVLQVGGNDQWGNLTSGTELIRKAEGKVAHALTTPLITKADGTKFGKTESGTVWLDGELTSPYAFYQFWFNVEDASVDGYLKVFSFRTRAELEALAEATAVRPHAREAQRALAAEVTTLVHGEAATASVMAASGALFGRGDLGDVDEATLEAALSEAGLHEMTGPPPTVVELLRATGLASSSSDARRTIAEGGANINNRRINDPEHMPSPEDLLFGRLLVVRRGKRAVAGVNLGARP